MANAGHTDKDYALPYISIIIPVKNGALLLPRCLESLKQQDYPPELFEVIISDGLSTDNTVEIALSYGAKVIKNEKGTVAPGRNIGFTASIGEIIVFTDDDCVMERSWLRNSVKYFKDQTIGGLTGPTITPEEDSHFSRAVGWIFSFMAGFNMSSHADKANKQEEIFDIPGCNAFYRRSVLMFVMPIDEGLLTAEDVELNYRVRKLGYKLLRVPDVVLYHYRRPTIRRLWKQFYRFAIGRLQVGKRHKELLKPFHILGGLSLPMLLILFICLSFVSVKWAIVLLAGLILGLILFILAALLNTGSLKIAINVTLVIMIMISAWSLGFLRELLLPIKDVAGK